MNILKEIEKNKRILDLKYKGIPIWPVLRLKSFYQILEQQKGATNITRKLNTSSVLAIFKCFFYGFSEIFKLSNYDYLVFSCSERRKQVDGKYPERVVEGFLSETNSLLIENPFPIGRHYKRHEIPTKHIMSESILFVGIFILGFFGFKKSALENKEVFLDIQKKYDFKINYNRFLLIYEGQYRLIKLMLTYSKKPKGVFFVYSASSMGYIKAFKEFNVPVIEIQHGVINREHNAYNVYNDFGKTLFPDYLLTYGNREMEVFNNPENYFINPKNVRPVGYYLLDKYLSNNSDHQNKYIQNYKEKYKNIVAYTHQEVYEKEILDFLIESASLAPNVLFLLLPRFDLKDQRDNMPENLIIEKNLNVYDCLGFVDIHSTIFSTCAIESLSFGVPNIMYNYQNFSRSYYADILGDEKHTVFVESPYEFVHAILNHSFESKEYITAASDNFFKRNFIHNINSFIEEELKP